MLSRIGKQIPELCTLVPGTGKLVSFSNLICYIFRSYVNVLTHLLVNLEFMESRIVCVRIIESNQCFKRKMGFWPLSETEIRIMGVWEV